jgi:hypothetical protein
MDRRAHPGPLRILFENRTDVRTLPSVWIAGEQLHDLLGKRRPFLTAKRLLTNQTFRTSTAQTRSMPISGSRLPASPSFLPISRAQPNSMIGSAISLPTISSGRISAS